MQNTQNKERDWSDVVEKIANQVRAFCFSYDLNYDKNSLFDMDVRKFIMPILQEADKKHNATPETHKPDGETLEFVVGELYEYMLGKTMVVGKLVDFSDNECVFRHGNNFTLPFKHCVLRKHVPAPKEHKIELWVNVYMIDGKLDFNYYNSKRDADTWSTPRCIACIHIEREFYEGEGLDG